MSASEEESATKVYDARLMRRLIGYVAPYRGMASGAVVLLVLSAILDLVGPLATGVALDLFIRPDAVVDTSVAADLVLAALVEAGVELTPMEGLAWVSGIFLGSLALGFFVLYLQGWLMQLMGQLIMRDLRQQIFGRLQELPVAYFDRQPVGRLVTRVTTDVDALNELFTAGLVAIVGDLVLLVGIMGVLFWLDWRLAIATFAVLPLLLALMVWFKTRARRSYREVRRRIAVINSFLQEFIGGMFLVQLFGKEKEVAESFREADAAHRDANVRAIFYYAVYYPAVELLTALGTALIIWYGGGEVIRGALSLGAWVAFLQYAQRFYQPLADLSDKYNILQSAMASSERIFELLDTEAEIVSPMQAHEPEETIGELEFSDVSFAYREGENVIEDVGFRIDPGETVAVVGHTGAGKSTLANLILRFYDVQKGEILLDGVDVRSWDLKALRRSIGMVLQDVFLFAGSVSGNLRLGESGIDDDRLRWAAEEVRALAFIERLEGGFDAEVRERGAGLSVGQKQLLAFARALAFDPRILILDEATSSVDTETEHLIQAALERLFVGRTSLVIAHRLSTVRRADRILVMHRGRLREQGTHQELLALRGIYRRLYELQFADQEPEILTELTPG